MRYSFLLVGLFMAVSAAAQESSVHTGTAKVIDADTIWVGDQKYRFDGIDSPERGAMCGEINVYEAGSDALRAFIADRPVLCEPNGKRNGERLIATCFVADEPVSLSEAMVIQGWARDWPRYSGARFADLEAEAREQNLGIWQVFCLADLWGNRRYE